MRFHLIVDEQVQKMGLDTVYVEDLAFHRDHWLARSEKLGLKSKCDDTGKDFFIEILLRSYDHTNPVI